MRSFRKRFRDYLGRVIVEIQVGLGPCGELRYPESNATWKFPGIGEFQCYDKYMRASLEAASEAIGKHDWGKAGPHDSGHYKQFPKETGFFQRDGAWKYRTPSTDSSSWSGTWELGKLPEHGDRILTQQKQLSVELKQSFQER